MSPKSEITSDLQCHPISTPFNLVILWMPQHGALEWEFILASAWRRMMQMTHQPCNNAQGPANKPSSTARPPKSSAWCSPSASSPQIHGIRDQRSPCQRWLWGRSMGGGHDYWTLSLSPLSPPAQRWALNGASVGYSSRRGRAAPDEDKSDCWQLCLFHRAHLMIKKQCSQRQHRINDSDPHWR